MDTEIDEPTKRIFFIFSLHFLSPFFNGVKGRRVCRRSHAIDSYLHNPGAFSARKVETVHIRVLGLLSCYINCPLLIKLPLTANNHQFCTV